MRWLLPIIVIIYALETCICYTLFPPRSIKSYRGLNGLIYATSTSEVAPINSWIQDQVLSSTISKDDVKKVEFFYDIMTKQTVVKAATTIKKDETILSIPLNLCIDAAYIESKINANFKPSIFRTSDFGLLALFLLVEKYSLSGHSYGKYKKYIDSLEEKPKGIFGWDDKYVEEFISSTTRNVQNQLNAAESDYNTIQSSNIFPSEYKERISEDAFFWALGIVKSRSVQIEGKLYLLPGLDSISYDPFSYSEPVISSGGFFSGKTVKVVAERSYEPGEPIVMSYGLKSSAECLEDHGLLPDLAIEDSCCELTVSLDGNEKFYDDKANVLEYFERQEKYRVDLEADPEVPLDEELLRFLRLKFIEGTDAFILESVFSNTVYNALSLPFSKVNEMKVMKYLLEDCLKKLEVINSVSSDERDTEISGAKGDSDIESNLDVSLARLRIQERATLKSTIMKVEEELISLGQVGGLDPREYYQERRLRELNLLRPLEDDEIVPPN